MASDAYTFDDALSELCSIEWSTSNKGTRHQEDVLAALLPASRTVDGRATLGENQGAIRNLAGILSDPLIFLEDLGATAVRLLRNICARSQINQERVAESEVHLRVIECIERRLELYDSPANGAGSYMPAAIRRVDQPAPGEEDHSRLRLPFFGFAVEFLVNFATGNAANAAKIWERAFPSVFSKLLECDNPAAASAAAALVHNCIAVLPERISDIVKIWKTSAGEGRSLAHSLLTQVRVREEGDDAAEFEKFSWSYLVIKRVVESGMLVDTFSALGPGPQDVIKSNSADFTPDQLTLLSVLDAAIGKSAERPSQESQTDVRVPEGTLPFFSELAEVSLLRGNGDMLRLALSIAGSMIIMCNESPELCTVKLTCAKVAVDTLQKLARDSHSTSKRGIHVSGLRAVSVRAIALACDRYRAAQDLVREENGIGFVLSSLSYEKDPKVNPFLREWAIIAVRNLCLGNEQNAEEISSYELQDIKQDKEFLRKAGLEAFMDDSSGQRRVRFRQVDQS